LQIDDDVLIVNEVGLGTGETLQDTVVDLLHALLVVTAVLNQLVLALLQLHLHTLDYLTGQLLLQPLLLDCEVNQHHLGSDLGLVPGIGQFGGHEKPEVLVVSDVLVAQVDHIAISHLLYRLVEQWL
jgi:hypothetical protein